MLERACLACGHRGPSLQRRSPDRALRCPGCGADLYSRPPRSYAELEGFVPIEHDEIDRGSGESIRPARRWPAARRFVVRAVVVALVVTPPLVVVAGAGALAALWIVRR